MGKRRTYPLAFSVLLISGTAWGQACSIDLGPDTTICQGQTVTLTAPPGYPDHLWSTGSSATSITVGTGGTYWGQVSYPSGELVTNGNFNGGNTGFSTQFNYNSTLTTDGNYWIGTNAASYHPQFLGTGNGAFLIVNAGWMHAGWDAWCQTIDVCPGQTYNLRVRAMSLATQGSPLLDWSIDGVQQNYGMQNAGQATWTMFTNTWTSGPTQTSATFCIRVASGHGIGNDFGIDDISISSTIVLRDEVAVTVTPLPVVDLGPDATLCAGQNLVLDAGVAGGTYLWQDGSTASSFVVNAAGNYNVTVTANQCSASDVITVNYDPLPVVDLGSDQTLCTGQTVTLDATQPGATYVWQDGSTGSTLNVTGPGTYTVSVTVNNCTSSDGVDIAYNLTPVVDLGPDQVICDGTTVDLDATLPGASYLWQDGTALPTYTASTAGSYGVQVTVNGCSASDAMDLVVTPLPAVDLGPDQTVCPGTSVLLDATVPGGTYLWQDGSVAATIDAMTPGVYSVQVTSNGCTRSDDLTLSHFPLQTVDLGPDITICQGQAATIGAVVPGAVYTWNTGATSADIGVSAAGVYWLDATLNGCTVRDSIEIFVTPLPSVDLGADISICPGTQVPLDASVPGGSYSWNTGDVSATIDVGPGTYDVTVTVNGCSDSDAIVVNAWPSPSVDLGNDVSLCPGSQLVLDATQPGADYLWQDGSQNGTFTVAVGGTYAVELTDANGCVATDEITVTFAAPTPITLGPDTTICQGNSLLLDATVQGASYLWNTGAVTPTINAASTGTYSVVVTQGNCTVNDAIDVLVAALPSVALGNDTTLCPGDQLVLNATGPGLTYLWNTGAATPAITVTTGGTYDVTVTNSANCAATDAISVTYASPVSVDLGADLVLCQGQDGLLDATTPGGSYLWNTGAVTPTITVSTPGTYSVVVTQGNCSVTDEIDVTVLPVPLVNLGDDVTLCAGEDIVLDATWPGATYLWNTGAITPTLTASSSGTYSVDVDLDGCLASDAIEVTVLSATTVDLGPDVTLCDGEQTLLDATTPGATYLWSTGALTPTITVSASGTYSVEVFSGACSVTDDVAVVVNPVPVIDLGPDLVFCSGETSTVLEASWPGATVEWSTGENTPSIVVNSTGSYSVNVDLNGCTATDEVMVTFGSLSLSLGPDTTLCPGEYLELGADLPDGTVTWNDAVTDPTFLVTEAGTYWLLFSGSSGCTATDTIVVSYAEPGALELGADTMLCDGEVLTLDATLPGAAYSWEDGSTAPIRSIQVNGTYAVQVSVGNCVLNDAISVSFTPLPVVDLGPDQERCPGQSATFDASAPGATYLWHDGSTAPTLTTGTAGTVSVEVTVNGCTGSDAANLSIIDGPNVDLGADTTLCQGAALTLDATQGSAAYLWEDGSTDPMRTITTEGIFWVDVTRNTCIQRDSITVDVFTPGAFDLGADRTICSGSSIVIDATFPGAQYAWSTGATTPTITINGAGTFGVTITVSGCTAEDDVIVDLIELEAPDLGPDVQVCEGASLDLQVEPGGAAVLWSTGETSPSITVTEAGVYGVTLDSLGCTASDAIVVGITPMIGDLGLVPDLTLCEGSSTILEATPVPGAIYTWNTGANGSAIRVDAPGIYTVTATGPCIEATASVVVTADDCGTYVSVPNTFTPNNDGINDLFLPIIDGPLDRFELAIYDRWGERIHTTTERDAGWDGSYDGVDSQDGVYVWTLSYRVLGAEGVKAERLTGHVTLLR